MVADTWHHRARDLGLVATQPARRTCAITRADFCTLTCGLLPLPIRLADGSKGHMQRLGPNGIEVVAYPPGKAATRMLVPLAAVHHDGISFVEVLPRTAPGNDRVAEIQGHLAPPREPAPTPGRIVMCCMARGEHPAIVTGVTLPDLVNLHVFVDGEAPQVITAVPKQTSPPLDLLSWRWPDRS